MSNKWSIVAAQFVSERDSLELLEQIVRLYVCIMGHSLAASWLKSWKHEKSCKVKKSHALQKSLRGPDDGKYM